MRKAPWVAVDWRLQSERNERVRAQILVAGRQSCLGYRVRVRIGWVGDDVERAPLHGKRGFENTKNHC